MESSSLEATTSLLEVQLEDIKAAVVALNNLIGSMQRLLETQAEAESGRRLEEVIESLANVAETFSSSANAMRDALGPINTVVKSQERQERQLDEIQARILDLMGWLGRPPPREVEPTS